MKYFILAVVLFLNMSSIALAQEAAAPAAQPMNLMQMVMFYADMLAQFMFGLMIVASVLVRVIPGKKDDEALSSIWSKVQKVLGYMPTFGINPRTKKLQEALDAMKSSDK